MYVYALGGMLLSQRERHEEFCSENRCFYPLLWPAGMCELVFPQKLKLLNPTKNNTGRQTFIQSYREVL